MKRPKLKRGTVRGLDLRSLMQGLLGEGASGDRIVPPTGFTAHLTLFAAGAMAFLAVFALALSMATGRLAERWSESLAQTVTIRVSAPAGEIDGQTDAALQILRVAPGAGDPHLLAADEVADLLTPWFGPDVPVDALPVPRLIELPIADPVAFDADGLRLRLEGEVPSAVLDDHTEWRRPLVSAAHRLQVLGIFSLMLIAAASAAMITLAAKAALAANGQVIRVLRLIGARDITIATAFVRRFTRRAAIGAAVGTVLGLLAIIALPDLEDSNQFLTGLGFQGLSWLWALLIPVVAAAVGFLATRWAALSMLGQVR